VSSKEVTETVIDAVRQFHRLICLRVNKFAMSHGIERLIKGDSVNDYIRVGFEHSSDFVD